jgi:hypothetical protein
MQQQTISDRNVKAFLQIKRVKIDSQPFVDVSNGSFPKKIIRDITKHMGFVSEMINKILNNIHGVCLGIFFVQFRLGEKNISLFLIHHIMKFKKQILQLLFVLNGIKVDVLPIMSRVFCAKRAGQIATNEKA